MRNLVYAINMSLDGCVDHTKVAVYEDLLEFHINLVRSVDTFVFGRVTYQLMVPYWPDIAKNPTNDKSDDEFAQAFVSVKEMVVISRSLDRVEGKNARLVKTNLAEEILKLKQEPGRNILVGGVDIPSQLIQLGLVDEFHFVIGPNMAGEGRRFLSGTRLPERLNVKLVSSKTFDSGCIALHYIKG